MQRARRGYAGQCEEPRACGELWLEHMLTLQLPGCGKSIAEYSVRRQVKASSDGSSPKGSRRILLSGDGRGCREGAGILHGYGWM